MPDYVWVCHSCKHSNPPGALHCQACGFPAEATGAEIEEHITGRKRPPRQSGKEFLKARREEMAALPFWKKSFAYLLRAVQLLGSITVWMGIVEFSLPGIALGIVAVAASEVGYQWLKGKPRLG